jgi:glutamate/tyrosine decarboxylase-like PLP-dependent enzyme
LPTSLDLPPAEFEQLLHRTAALVRDRYEHLDGKAFCGESPDEVAGWFDEPLPESGGDLGDLLQEVKTKVLDTATLNIGSNMYAYVMAGGNQVSIAADLLVSAINQNVTKWHLAPALTELEKRVIQWTGQFVGYDAAAGGAIVSSGSAANLMGLTVGRNVFLEQAGVREKGLFGMPPTVVYASSETHGSVDKSMDVLGLGSDQLRHIPVDADFRIDVDALRAAIQMDRSRGLQPFCVIGNAGTVNTGAIDPMTQLADLCREEGLWFHVDGSYGGLASAVPELAGLYAGMERADSLALDYHKWLYQPFEIGCTLVRDWTQLERTFKRSASYLDTDKGGGGRFDINEHHFQLSRNGKALKVWMSLKAYGTDRFKDMIRKDVALRSYLCQTLDDAEDFEVVSDGPLAIATFQYVGSPGSDLRARRHESGHESRVAALNAAMVPAIERDGRIFLTGTILDGRQVLRACIINHRTKTSDIDFMVQVLREVGRSVE